MKNMNYFREIWKNYLLQLFKQLLVKFWIFEVTFKFWNNKCYIFLSHYHIWNIIIPWFKKAQKIKAFFSLRSLVITIINFSNSNYYNYVLCIDQIFNTCCHVKYFCILHYSYVCFVSTNYIHLYKYKYLNI